MVAAACGPCSDREWRSVSWNVAVGLLNSSNPHWSGLPKLVRCKPTWFEGFEGFEGFERFVACPLYNHSDSLRVAIGLPEPGVTPVAPRIEMADVASSSQGRLSSVSLN